jgi:cell wall-associated NlpC family hydrolase
VTSLTLHFRHSAGKIALAVAAVLATSGATIAVVVPTAGADQLANERAEAQVLSTKIAALGEQEAALGEQYDAGLITLAQANARVAAANRAMARARVGQDQTTSLLQQDAVEAYVGAGPQMALSSSLPLDNMNDALLRQELVQTFADSQADALDSYQLAAANAATAHAQLVAARNAAARQVAQLQTDRDQVQAAENQLVDLQQQVKGQIAALVAQIEHEELLAEQRAEAERLAQERAQAAAEAAAQARAAAAARAAAQAAEAKAEAQAAEEAQAAAAARAAAAATARKAANLALGSPSATTVPAAATTTTVPVSATVTTAPAPAIPGVSAAASAAVAAAESRVGDPYVWGAAGPDEFDCSGLVMWAYAQAGVYLPHYSGAQFDDTVQIPMSDLEPGDLVFPADPGEHVAMYIGDGEIVQAPYTGADVQIVPLSGFFVLATRVG